ncbi:hypothetical protein, partial [Azospirillum brasilense]|uniref:hypothetical protein n=1 Tax=Azospirillum brasilense TaxID=192 RepID=UPI001B3B7F55
MMNLLRQNIQPRTIETMAIMSIQSRWSMSLLSPLHFRCRMYPGGHTRARRAEPGCVVRQASALQPLGRLPPTGSKNGKIAGNRDVLF